tara:strand:- start:332 stop:877 length:546 start_codon:yes stop_codon:yes gene_type:complete
MKPRRWEIENFATPNFCQSMIDKAETIGFEKATITTSAGPILRIEYRHNERVTFDDQNLANELFEKVKDDPQLHNPGWECIGLNERFKIYKYSGPDQYFASHYDGSFERVPLFEQSWVTMLLYLNEDFEGGQTSFVDGEIEPKTGLAAFMTQHNYLHEAREATGGSKYVLRTDVMYRLIEK